MIAYLGDGKASPGLSYAPQILTTDQYLLALVSPDLSAGVIELELSKARSACMFSSSKDAGSWTKRS